MKVAILTPSYTGAVQDDHAQALAQTVRACEPLGIRVHYIPARGSANLPRTRNMLVANAMAANCEAVVFIDADIGWDAADFIRILRCPDDVIGVAPQKRTQYWRDTQATLAYMPVQGRDAMLRTYEGGASLMEVERAATAFLKVTRGAFERLKYHAKVKQFYYPTMDDRARAHLYNYFWYEMEPETIDGNEVIVDRGEDYYFCRLWNEMGGKIYLDTQAVLRHWEGVNRHDYSLKEAISASAAD